MVVGDKKQKKIIVADDEKFDEKMIPLKKWSAYEQELWEMGSTGSKETGLTGHSYRSHHSRGSRGNQSGVFDNRSHYGASQIGEFDYYRNAQSAVFDNRSHYAGSQLGEYDYYRDNSFSPQPAPGWNHQRNFSPY